MTFRSNFFLRTLSSSFEIVKKSFTFDCYNLQIHKTNLWLKFSIQYNGVNKFELL